MCQVEICGLCVRAMSRGTGMEHLWYCSEECQSAYKVVASIRSLDLTLVACPWCPAPGGTSLRPEDAGVRHPYFIDDAGRACAGCHCAGTGNVSVEYLHMYRLFHGVSSVVAGGTDADRRRWWRSLTPAAVQRAEE